MPHDRFKQITQLAAGEEGEAGGDTINKKKKKDPTCHNAHLTLLFHFIQPIHKHSIESVGILCSSTAPDRSKSGNSSLFQSHQMTEWLRSKGTS